MRLQRAQRRGRIRGWLGSRRRPALAARPATREQIAPAAETRPRPPTHLRLHPRAPPCGRCTPSSSGTAPTSWSCPLTSAASWPWSCSPCTGAARRGGAAQGDATSRRRRATRRGAPATQASPCTCVEGSAGGAGWRPTPSPLPGAFDGAPAPHVSRRVEAKRGYDVAKPGSQDADPIFGFKLPAHEVGYPGVQGGRGRGGGRGAGGLHAEQATGAYRASRPGDSPAGPWPQVSAPSLHCITCAAPPPARPRPRPPHRPAHPALPRPPAGGPFAPFVPGNLEELKVKEIKNGRLAMLGFIGGLGGGGGGGLGRYAVASL